MGLFDFLGELAEEVVDAAERNAEHNISVQWGSVDQYAYASILQQVKGTTEYAVAYAKACGEVEKETDPVRKREMECLIERGIYDFSLLDD